MNRITHYKLPSIFGFLVRSVSNFFSAIFGYEFMFTPGGLVGQYWPVFASAADVHGERFSFRRTPNFEFGMSRTTDYGGPGYPLTWHTFLGAFFRPTRPFPGRQINPGPGDQGSISAIESGTG